MYYSDDIKSFIIMLSICVVIKPYKKMCSVNEPAAGNAEPQLGTVEQNETGAVREEASICHETRWYSRGYLPHCDKYGLLQSITFRLADSPPHTVLKQLEQELASRQQLKKDIHRRNTIQGFLDSGFGCCALQHPEMANKVQDTLLTFDGSRYRLIAWCIMPNHVHVLIEPLIGLGKIVQSWKSYTARWAIKHHAELGLGVPGTSFWMREYWDRYIRNEQHLQAVIEYIHQNPVKARLCSRPEEWRWSSASHGTQYSGGTVT